MNTNQPVAHLPAPDLVLLRSLGIDIANTYVIPDQECRFLGTTHLDNGARVGITVFNCLGLHYHFRLRFFRAVVQVETRAAGLVSLWAKIEAIARGRAVRINPEILSLHEVPFIDFLNGAPDETGQWFLGVERDKRVLWLDGSGHSHKKPETFHGITWLRIERPSLACRRGHASRVGRISRSLCSLSLRPKTILWQVNPTVTLLIFSMPKKSETDSEGVLTSEIAKATGIDFEDGPYRHARAECIKPERKESRKSALFCGGLTALTWAIAGAALVRVVGITPGSFLDFDQPTYVTYFLVTAIGFLSGGAMGAFLGFRFVGGDH